MSPSSSVGTSSGSLPWSSPLLMPASPGAFPMPEELRSGGAASGGGSSGGGAAPSSRSRFTSAKSSFLASLNPARWGRSSSSSTASASPTSSSSSPGTAHNGHAADHRHKVGFYYVSKDLDRERKVVKSSCFNLFQCNLIIPEKG